MASIELTKGKSATVDDADLPLVSRHSWFAQEPHLGYWQARAMVAGKLVLMHRYLLGIADPIVEVDHWNHNLLDNRRENLRIVSHQVNMGNQRKRRDNTSGFKGVSRRSDTGQWTAYINFEGKRMRLGCFDRAWKAAKRYRRAAQKLGYAYA